MQRHPRQERLNRIQLIGRVQFAYEQLKETMQRYHDDSPRARAAIAADALGLDPATRGPWRNRSDGLSPPQRCGRCK